MCTLTEHETILEQLERRLQAIETTLQQLNSKLDTKIDTTQSCLLARVDRLDDRLRSVEQKSAIYGTAGGAIISTLISVGIRLILGGK